MLWPSRQQESTRSRGPSQFRRGADRSTPLHNRCRSRKGCPNDKVRICVLNVLQRFVLWKPVRLTDICHSEVGSRGVDIPPKSLLCLCTRLNTQPKIVIATTRY